MNLIIDVGNTFIKLAVFKGEEIIHKEVVDKSSFLSAFNKSLQSHPEISHGIISSVGSFTETDLATLQHEIPFVVLTSDSIVPFKNIYKTPKTLGVDRLALVSAAAVKYPEENVLVVDAGSCITYDFLNQDNEYLGGAISPGIDMRYKAMHTFTAALPLLDAKMPKKIIGDSTNNAMHIGAIQGVIYEIEGFIADYIEKSKDLTVILTGGDAHFLRDSIKNNIFATSNFLLEGLNHILETNKHS